MAEVIAQTVYFDKEGPDNTERTLQIARAHTEGLGIRTVLVASARGVTGVRATQVFRDFNLIVVTASTGILEPDRNELTEENRAIIEAAGATILTCQHALGGVGRAVRKKLGTYQIDEIIAYTLRIFGQGIKVTCEIALMAADAGLVRTDELVMAIAGKGRGADTAVVLRPTNAQTFFDLGIVDIICRPSPYHPAWAQGQEVGTTRQI